MKQIITKEKYMTYEQMREETSRLLDTPWGDLKDGYEKEKRIEIELRMEAELALEEDGYESPYGL
jgi:hypothetical protein